MSGVPSYSFQISLITPYIIFFSGSILIPWKSKNTFRILPDSANRSRIQYKIFSHLWFFFFTGSVCGYVWEVLIFLVKEGTFRNRGFLYGPWLPVYGIGAVLFSVILSPRELLPDSSGKYKKNHPVTVFFLSALLGSGLELVIGWFLDLFWNLRYWDYSGYFLDFRGYICLVSALGFGIAGVLWVCIFSKILQKWWYHISLDFRKKWNMFGVFIFVTDCAAALIFPNTGHSITF